VSKAKDIAGLAAWVVACNTAGVIGVLTTDTGDSAWYRALAKPDWTPPSWVFGPVWTTLYVLMGVAAWLVWRRHGLRGGFRGASGALGLFVTQLVLNGLWTPIFFGLRWLWVASVEITLLLGLIAATIGVFWRINRLAAALLLPYLAWVAYATALTWRIAWLNA
jgi:benzodiazapine receptor